MEGPIARAALWASSISLIASIGASGKATAASYNPPVTVAPRESVFSLTGAIDRSAPGVAWGSGSNASFTSGTGFGVGADYGHPLTDRFDWHLGAIYSRRAWQDSAYGNQRMAMLEVPAYLEFRAHRFFAIDAGLYYGLMNFGTKVSYLSSGDYGLLGGVKFLVPVSKKTRVFAGANYLYGIYNVSEVGGSLGMHDVQIVFGVQFSLGSGTGPAKKPGPRPR